MPPRELPDRIHAAFDYHRLPTTARFLSSLNSDSPVAISKSFGLGIAHAVSS